jgi:hypothetical protein
LFLIEVRLIRVEVDSGKLEPRWRFRWVRERDLLNFGGGVEVSIGMDGDARRVPTM